MGVVGKSDFNENPVVSLDLDLDFGLRLRVCQKRLFSGRLPENKKLFSGIVHSIIYI